MICNRNSDKRVQIEESKVKKHICLVFGHY